MPVAHVAVAVAESSSSPLLYKKKSLVPYATTYGVPVPVLAFAVATTLFVGVITCDVVIGLVVLHVRAVLQLLAHAGIVQLVAVRVPEGGVDREAVHVPLIFPPYCPLQVHVTEDPGEGKATLFGIH